MSEDLKLCVEIIGKAIKFEEEGMAFFKSRAESAPSAFERRLFTSLAKDEAGHKDHLIKMREDIQRENSLEVLPDAGNEPVADMRGIFEASLAEAQDPYDYKAEEYEILKGAMDVERRGYTLYSNAAAAVTSPRAKAVFEHLAAEEQSHYTLLKNTYDYLVDPEGFAGFDGECMLDGG